MATKVLNPKGQQFEPLARNAFRALGLAASASQGEIYERATSLRLAHKLGVEKTFAADLVWLGPVSRTEADVRDALGRLSDPPRRILERLFWFHTVPEIEPPTKAGAVAVAADRLLSIGGPAARHDAALFSLAALQRLDPGFNRRDEWARAYALWREVVEGEEFWSLFVADDLRGEFVQLTNFGEVRELRARTPRLLTAHVAERAKDAATRDDFEACVRALGLLRAASLPRALLGEYEEAVLGPFEDRLERTCDDAFALGVLYYGGDAPNDSKKYYFDEAWKNFHWKVKPQLRKFFQLAGAEHHGLRRSCERTAEKLSELAAAYNRYGFQKQSLYVFGQARALAPPGSSPLSFIEGRLRSLDQSSLLLERDEAAYAELLAAELADMKAPGFFDSEKPGALPTTGGDTIGGCAGQLLFYAFVVASCFLLNKCGFINTSRPSRQYPGSYNFNYAAPRMTPFPIPNLNLRPLTIPAPLLNEPKPKRQTRRGRREGNRGGTMEAPLPPPTSVPRAPTARPSPTPATPAKN